MGVILDVISGHNLIAVVTDNIPKAVDLTGMGVTQFFSAVRKTLEATGFRFSVSGVMG